MFSINQIDIHGFEIMIMILKSLISSFKIYTKVLFNV